MISRRHLRIKIMQILFAYFLNEDKDLKQCENELIKSVEKLYDSYLLIFLMLSELAEISRVKAEDKVEKHIKVFMAPEVNSRFYDNEVIQTIINDKAFIQLVKKRKLTWQPEHDTIASLFVEIKSSKLYISYCRKPKGSFDDDMDFLKNILQELLYPSVLFQSLMEEKCFHWEDDNKLVQTILTRTVKSFKEGSENVPLQPLYKEEEDKIFMMELLRATIIHNKEFEQKISMRTKNWELDRIALMDIVLMKMSLAEMLFFSEIPVKVTINEILEISKEYSSKGSNFFINGVIDQLRVDYLKEGKIVKVGKGLMESEKKSIKESKTKKKSNDSIEKTPKN